MAGSRGSSTTTSTYLPGFARGAFGEFFSKSEAHSGNLTLTKLKAVTTTSDIAPAYIGTHATDSYDLDRVWARQDAAEDEAIKKMVTLGTIPSGALVQGNAFITKFLNGTVRNGDDPNYIARLALFKSKATTEYNNAIVNLLTPKPLFVSGVTLNWHTTFNYDVAAVAVEELGVVMAYSLYAEGRRQELSAAGAALDYERQDFNNLDLTRTAGLYKRLYDQGLLEHDYQKFLFEDGWEVRRLEILGNALRASIGTYSSTTRPHFRGNKGAAMLGGAMSGAAALSTFGVPGAIGGAVGGALLGYLTSDDGENQ